MRKHDQQGTPFNANWMMFTEEVRNVVYRRPSRIWHKTLNIFVEAVRAYPTITVFILLGLVVSLVEWYYTGDFL